MPRITGIEFSGGKKISFLTKPSIYMELRRHFPMPEIRPEQEKILNKVAKALEDGKKYIIIEAPPGSGKSPIAITLCNCFVSGYICTDQKSLQDQYLYDRNFQKTNLTQIIGRSNSVCKQASMDVEPGEEVYCHRGLCVQDRISNVREQLCLKMMHPLHKDMLQFLQAEGLFSGNKT